MNDATTTQLTHTFLEYTQGSLFKVAAVSPSSFERMQRMQQFYQYHTTNIRFEWWIVWRARGHAVLNGPILHSHTLGSQREAWKSSNKTVDAVGCFHNSNQSDFTWMELCTGACLFAVTASAKEVITAS